MGVAHERYQSYFADLPFTFILLNIDGWKKWDSTYAKIPDNFIEVNKLTPDLMPNIILSQHKFGQFQLLSKISQSLRIPMIHLEHVLPSPKWDKKRKRDMANMIAHVNIYLSEFSRKAWGISESTSMIIKQCVDSNVFRPIKTKRIKSVLSVVNEYADREGPCNYSGWLKTTKGIPTKLVGTSKHGLSSPAKDINDLVNIYNKYEIFLNTSRHSTCPFTLFEAMACGSLVVSTATTMIPEVIQNGYNGFLYDINKPEDGRELIKRIFQMDQETLDEVRQNARNTMVSQFSKQKFIEEWTEIVNECINIPAHVLW
jgi:glycosyltransferase involved in cell wall biosynthesis